MWFCEDSVGRAELEQNHLEINCLGRKTRVALRDGRLIVLGDFADRGRRVYDLLWFLYELGVRLAWLVAMCTEARVREAEETVRLSELLHSDVPPSGPSGSERYEAFLDWQQFGRLVEP